MKFWRAFVVVMGAIMAQGAWAQTSLRFAFDEGSPPYSYMSADGKTVGLFPELVKAVFAYLPEYSVKLDAYPWARAQDMVLHGNADGFLTYPSEKRKAYANFASESIFVEDIGFLAFLPSNPNAPKLRRAKNFEDLRPFLLLGSNVSDWENENVPRYIRKESIPKDESRINVLVYRKHGDFILMGREIANHLLTKLGYDGKIEFAKVDFIPDSQVPFHLGISNKHPDAAAIIAKVNKIVATPQVRTEILRIEKKYQGK